MEGLHLSDWFYPFSLKDTIEKETFIFVFPWYVEFKVFGVWKYVHYLKIQLGLLNCVKEKRELLVLAVCCISSFLTLWLVSGNWGGKTGTAQEEVTGFVKPVLPDMALSAQNSSADSAFQKVPVLQVSLLYLI